MSTTSCESTDDPWCMSTHPRVIEFCNVEYAKNLISSGIVKTPCAKSHLNEMTGMDVYLKKEFLQFTGSFKERGARFALMLLDDEQKKKGVISASLGNHSQGISYHGADLGIPVTVVMPVVAPLMKVQKCRKFKANVVLEGNNMAESKKIALGIAKEKGLLYINGYDHPHVIAGQGTIGLEILEQVENVDAVIVPCGGGGLIAGVALAIKTKSPKTKIIGVESSKCAGFSNAMRHGKPISTTYHASLADGLAVSKVGYNSLATAKKYIDKIIVVEEDVIAVAILHILEQEKCIVEGAGASPLAAILSGQLSELKGKRVVLVCSGGNIDTTLLGRCLERGMAVIGRFVKCCVYIIDQPGGISELSILIASIGVSIKDIYSERAWILDDVFTVKVKVTCETRDINHAIQLRKLLESHYGKTEFADFPSACLATQLNPLVQS